MNMDELPVGVKCIPLEMHHDHRGKLAELYRKNWQSGLEVLQWNITHSKANVLRGVHLHWNHTDYLIVVRGQMLLCLHDIRIDSATRAKTFTLNLTEDNLMAVVIPPGIAHGFYFSEETTHIYAVSDYWMLEDELGCMWNSPELNMPWPTKQPILSKRDIEAPSYDAMIQKYWMASQKSIKVAQY